jgi:DNA-binding Lrp family transcriptional regulator
MPKDQQNKTEPDSKGLERHELDAIDQRILQLVLTYPGITDKEISEEVGLDRSTVNLRKNAPKVQAALNRYLQEPIDTIRDAMKKAARVLVKALDSQNEKVRVTTAIKILTSEGILKHHLDASDKEVSEPLVIETSKETITVYPSGIHYAEKDKPN